MISNIHTLRQIDCTQSYSFKYSYLMQIIHIQLYGFKRTVTVPKRLAERRKEAMKTESNALAGQKVRHWSWIFSLVFCCSSDMLDHWVVSSVRPPLGPTPKMGFVNFRLLTSSWLVFNWLSLPHHVSLFPWKLAFHFLIYNLPYHVT